MLTVINTTRHQQLVSCIKPAWHFWARLQGCFSLAWGQPWQGIHLQPCRSIHTLAMSRSLDVVFVDQDGYVLKWKTVKPWRLYFGGAKAWAALELPAGTCQAKQIGTGDRLIFMEQAGRAS